MKGMRVALAALAVLVSPAARASQATELASACASCHRADSAAGPIPSVAGMAEDSIVKSMLDYRTGQRSSQVMQAVSAALSQEEIRAVAHYLAVQPGPGESR